MLEIIEKYEVPLEYHTALWAALEAGADMGFFKALGVGSQQDSGTNTTPVDS